MKTFKFVAWTIVFTSILLLAKVANSKQIEVRHLVVPTQNGLEFRDTSLLIEITSTNSLSINGKLFTGLVREVSHSVEENIIYDLYSSRDESFNVCFDLDPDNGNILQVILYFKGNYYCFR